MNDPVALFRSARQKSGYLPITDEARQNLREWLKRKRGEGWHEADESEYLTAVAENIKDPERLKAAEDFWQTQYK